MAIRSEIPNWELSLLSLDVNWLQLMNVISITLFCGPWALPAGCLRAGIQFHLIS